MKPLNPGQGYTKEALQEIFSTNFGARIKGITLRRDPEGKTYALVFSRANGPYADRLEADEFYYDGEGSDKDQELTAANKALLEANRTGRLLYGFRQEVNGGLWHYLGILEAIDYAYISKRGYKTYEFHFRIQPVAPSELDDANKVIEDVSLAEPELTEDSKMTTVSVKARKAAFRHRVIQLYDNTCVVCEKKRLSPSGYPEVEAAHIYPKGKQGADDYRNGIALCRLHHWAFDAGLFTISDDLKVIVRAGLQQDDNYYEITRYEGKVILKPAISSFAPAQIYLAAHRALHGFVK